MMRIQCIFHLNKVTINGWFTNEASNLSLMSKKTSMCTIFMNFPLFVATFYNQPAVTDFIIDILVGSTQTDIRDVALDQFYILAQTETTPREQTSTTPTPQSFMLNTLLKARLPFWVTVSNSTRGASYR